MRRLRCPRCAAAVAVPDGQAPACPHCGFGAGGDASLAPQHPPGPARPVGRVRSSLLLGLLHVPTLGLSSLVWMLLATQEVDAHADGNAHKYGAPAAALLVVGGATAFLVGNELLPGLASHESAATTVLLVAFLASTTGIALALIALWKLWGQLERSQRDAGVAPTSRVGLMLLLVVPHAVVSVIAPFLFFGFLLALLATAAFGVAGFMTVFITLFAVMLLPSVLTAVTVGRTQAGMNRLWRAHG